MLDYTKENHRVSLVCVLIICSMPLSDIAYNIMLFTQSLNYFDNCRNQIVSRFLFSYKQADCLGQSRSGMQENPNLDAKDQLLSLFGVFLKPVETQTLAFSRSRLF